MILGHSWGAALALQYVQQHPEQVQKLVLVSSVGFDGPPPNYREEVAKLLAEAPEDDPWIARISTGFADRSTALEHAHQLNTPRFEPNRDGADELLAELKALPDRAGDCARIAVPTLLVHGAADLRPPSVTDRLLAALPNAERVVLDGVGHYPWVEDPDAFTKVVRAFLS